MKKIMRVLLPLMLFVLLLTGCDSKSDKAWKQAQEEIAGKEYKQAVTSLTTVIEETNTEDAEEAEHQIQALYLRGDCYHLLGEETKAEADYARALEADLADDSPESQTGTRFLRRGLLYMKQEDYQSALNCFEEGLLKEDLSSEKELLYNDIICREKLGDYAGAKEKLAIYTSAYPDDEDMMKEYTFLQTR